MSSTYTAFAISDLLKALAWLELFHDQECPTNLRKEESEVSFGSFIALKASLREEENSSKVQ